MTTHLPVTSSDVRETYADSEDFGFGTSANYANRAHAFDEWLDGVIEAARARGFTEGKAAGANEICLKLEEKISQTPIADLRANGIQSGFVIALRIASGVAQETLEKISESQL